MLVLTRKANEQIQIGDHVVITILQVKGQSVRVGIEAPREVRVLRSELPRTQELPLEEPATSPCPRPNPAKARRIRDSRPSLLRNSPLLASAAPLATRVEHFRISPASRFSSNGIGALNAVLASVVESPHSDAAADEADVDWARQGCGL